MIFGGQPCKRSTCAYTSDHPRCHCRLQPGQDANTLSNNSFLDEIDRASRISRAPVPTWTGSLQAAASVPAQRSAPARGSCPRAASPPHPCVGRRNSPGGSHGGFSRCHWKPSAGGRAPCCASPSARAALPPRNRTFAVGGPILPPGVAGGVWLCQWGAVVVGGLPCWLPWELSSSDWDPQSFPRGCPLAGQLHAPRGSAARMMLPRGAERKGLRAHSQELEPSSLQSRRLLSPTMEVSQQSI